MSLTSQSHGSATKETIKPTGINFASNSKTIQRPKTKTKADQGGCIEMLVQWHKV